jgi:hypothetical protein
MKAHAETLGKSRISRVGTGCRLAGTHIGCTSRREDGSISDPDIPYTNMHFIAQARNASTWLSEQVLTQSSRTSPTYSQIVTLLSNQETTLSTEWPRWPTTESMVQIRPSNTTMYSVSKFPSVMQSEVSTTYLYSHNIGLYPETNKFSPNLHTQFLLPPCQLRLGFTTDFFNRRFRRRNSDISIIYTMRTSRPVHLFPNIIRTSKKFILLNFPIEDSNTAEVEMSLALSSHAIDTPASLVLYNYCR